MYRAAEFDLALDIDDIARSHTCGRGNTNGMAIPILAEIGDGQPIDLANALSGRVDQQRVALDRIDDPGLQSAGSAAALAHRLCYILRFDRAGTAVPRPVVRLLDEIVERTHVHR